MLAAGDLIMVGSAPGLILDTVGPWEEGETRPGNTGNYLRLRLPAGATMEAVGLLVPEGEAELSGVVPSAAAR